MLRASIRGAVVVCVAVTYLASGCGSESERDRVQAGAGLLVEQVATDVPLRSFTDVQANTQFELATVATPEAVVVVEGGAATGNGLRAQLYVGRPNKLDLEVVAFPVEAPLLNVLAWWTGEEVAVVALPCPKWVDPAHPPGLIDDEAPPIEQQCGESRYLARAWDPDSGQWRTVSDDIVSGSGGVLFLRDSQGPRALLVETGREGRFFVVDGADGSVTTLPSLPFVAGDGTTSLDHCLAEDGSPFAVSVWGGPFADANPAGPPAWSPEHVVSRENGQNLAILHVAGNRWEPVPLAGTLPDGELFLSGCVGASSLISTVVKDPLEQRFGLITADTAESIKAEMLPSEGLPAQGKDLPALQVLPDSAHSALIGYAVSPTLKTPPMIAVFTGERWQGLGPGPVDDAPITLVTDSGVLIYPDLPATPPGIPDETSALRVVQ